ncbi:hypothetical protein VU01_10321, partial [Candidatus Electrothrix marina]
MLSQVGKVIMMLVPLPVFPSILTVQFIDVSIFFTMVSPVLFLWPE